MVGFSKLLIGAFIPSAYGSGKVKPVQTAALTEPTATITYALCDYLKDNTEPGMFFIEGTDCNVTSIAKNSDGNKIESWTKCSNNETRRYTTKEDENIKLLDSQGGGEVFKLSQNGWFRRVSLRR